MKIVLFFRQRIRSKLMEKNCVYCNNSIGWYHKITARQPPQTQLILVSTWMHQEVLCFLDALLNFISARLCHLRFARLLFPLCLRLSRLIIFVAISLNFHPSSHFFVYGHCMRLANVVSWRQFQRRVVAIWLSLQMTVFPSETMLRLQLIDASQCRQSWWNKNNFKLEHCDCTVSLLIIPYIKHCRYWSNEKFVYLSAPFELDSFIFPFIKYIRTQYRHTLKSKKKNAAQMHWPLESNKVDGKNIPHGKNFNAQVNIFCECRVFN